MRSLQSVLSDALHLFYPHICTGCGSDLLPPDHLLCLKCISRLPHTNFAMHGNNAIEKIFWGRLPLVAAHSEFYFAKDTLVQHLVHLLKYNNNQAIGFYLGQLMGKSMLLSNRFNRLDYLVPLPLYPEKEKKRGYNQAAVICNGVSDVMNVPVLINNVTRQRFTTTQTRKHRVERWENVAGSFGVADKTQLKHQHLLLVDDVITTGATLEACGQAILSEVHAFLYIATLATTTK